VTANLSNHHVIELPAIRGLLRHASWHLVEAVAIPMATFYLLLTLAGLTAALVVALVWTYGSIIRRLVIGERVPAILVLGTMLFTVRCVIAFMTNSVFLYFLQPTLGTYLVAALFLLSVPFGKPLAERLAHDFCPLPDALLQRMAMRRYFLRLSLMWALVYTVNASATLFLLLTQSTGTFMLLKSFSPVLTGSAIVVSYLWFRRSMRSENIVLKWGSLLGAQPATAEVAVAVAPHG
jgi:intracellular septation protein A